MPCLRSILILATTTTTLLTTTNALPHCGANQTASSEDPYCQTLPPDAIPAPITPPTPADGVPDIVIKSNCDFPVYLREVIAGTEQNSIHPFGPDGEDILITPGEVWTSMFYWPNLGISIKLSRDPWVVGEPQPLITQLEYTWEPEPQNLWYDISDIDCYDTRYPGEHGTDCPFFEDGVLLRSESECRVLKCFPLEDDCKDAYIYPNDDWETKCCTGKPVHLFADLCAKNVGEVMGVEEEEGAFFDDVDGEDPEARYLADQQADAVF
ncbi:hypothetical protein EJ05DRAFT_483796 [Pseudovirgaria hyperparasitica]|uniref:Osmotin, thaumatin-like protein n=1 Tax=Pseudovirgaria hyperparasitica TaxID=470096 RepID=A0A6A6WF27_9PEZI|nr:uncharacterized protein EJ05DRAFT_483796 [Pseudovirgaria hyperparasitica]KAF2761428.1 hypothetical protein EJ05DRAFT_483796 [Pseudovirgaria hyperparasitica]